LTASLTRRIRLVVMRLLGGDVRASHTGSVQARGRAAHGTAP
jgi:hypothetical protein